MRTQKWLFPFGMISVLFFLMMTISGRILWVGYNPVTTYVSALVTYEAPHSHLMRVFMNTYTICFLLFSLAMATFAFREGNVCLKMGYSILFIAAFISVLGYGSCPISLAFIFSKNDIVHVITTVSILCATVFALASIAAGYLRQEKRLALGRIATVTCIFFVLFNLWHLFAVMSAENVLGLVERLVFYTFHAFTFIVSWIYTFSLPLQEGITKARHAC